MWVMERGEDVACGGTALWCRGASVPGAPARRAPFSSVQNGEATGTTVSCTPTLREARFRTSRFLGFASPPRPSTLRVPACCFVSPRPQRAFAAPHRAPIPRHFATMGRGKTLHDWYRCTWHTGCTHRSPSKRQLFKHLEEVHGLHRADGVWRATGRGARAYRTDRRTPGLKYQSREEWRANLHRQGLTPSMLLREKAAAAAAEQGMSKALRKEAERDAARDAAGSRLAPPTAPAAAALTGAPAGSADSVIASPPPTDAFDAASARASDWFHHVRTGSITWGDVSSPTTRHVPGFCRFGRSPSTLLYDPVRHDVSSAAKPPSAARPPAVGRSSTADTPPSAVTPPLPAATPPASLTAGMPPFRSCLKGSRALALSGMTTS